LQESGATKERANCLHCQSPNCVHIGYSWAIPEVYKIMNLKGKKMPKIE
jgi:Fe-S-cluster-containing hydrogenase component 2